MHQHFFVNGRLVRSRSLSHALTLAYGGLLPTGRQPVCAITLEMVPRLVDPNAHPTKIEVRFSRPWEVHHLIEQVVVEGLRAASLIGEARFADPQPGPEPAAPRLGHPARRPRLPEAATGRLVEARPSPFADQVDEHEDGLEVHGASVAAELQPAVRAPVETSHRLDQARVLGQLRNTYILVETPDALLLINQHRASELAIAARLREQPGDPRRRFQRLTVPVSLELTVGESAAIQANLDLLLNLGFEVEPFGKTAWLIRAIPAFLEGRNYEEVLRGLAQDMADEGLPPDLGQRLERAVAVASCQAAVKAGDPLSQRDMEALVAGLAEAGSPGLCPHGDPVVVALTHRELDRRFGR
jgi:DNA mismatch repair protein MutL